MPKSTNKFLTMKQAPPRIKFEPDDTCSKMQYDPDLKMKVYWDPSGIIRIEYANGVREVYHPKPTLANVLARKNTAEYYRIHTDGSVEHGYDGEYYYWGPDEEVEWNMNTIEYCPVYECPCDNCISDSDTESYNSEDEPCYIHKCYCQYCRY